MFDITDDMFLEWPIVVCGTLTGPFFSTKHITLICGHAPIPNTTMPLYIDENDLYKWLEFIDNEFSCKLYCYIVDRLTNLRKNAINSMNNTSSNAYFVKMLLSKLITSSQQALKAYESNAKQESKVHDLSMLVSNLHV